MRWRPLLWLMLSLVCFAGSFYFWNLGNQWAAKKKSDSASNPSTNQPQPAKAAPQKGPQSEVRAAASAFALLSGSEPTPEAAQVKPPRGLEYRLSNTTRGIKELARSPRAILLENALVDTGRPQTLAIPEWLRAQGDPGAYIVQAKASLDQAFRSMLAEAGATVISYIPNNSYLVRATRETAQAVGGNPLTQAVLTYEPYYKLKSSLLELAVKQEPLPEESLVKVLLFGQARDQAITDLEQLGATVVSEERSPFGPVLLVKPPVDSIASVAALSGVQAVEMARPRVSANDLSRPALGVAPDTVSAGNYLGLTGAKVLVNVNDSGVAANHPDLQGRVLLDAPGSGVDTNGHGTHVAGIIASSGGQSATITNAQGSIMPPVAQQFRGKAPAAKIYAMKVGLEGGTSESGPSNLVASSSDEYLQEQAAQTNAFISNNSWHYQESRDYDLGAASYDAAVRDALPRTPGSQPLLYVFAAGNLGAGDDNGTGGAPGTVQSPGTAKNVITVGAVEQNRDITNEVWKCQSPTGGGTNGMVCTTNQPWVQKTDSSDQVASFSSRGNVGILIEGESGRFKPDLVAPGTFVVSTRSPQWDEGAYYNPTSHVRRVFPDLLAVTNDLWINSILIPDNAVQVNITASADNGVSLPIFVRQSAPPVLEPGGYDFVRTNSVTMPPDGGSTLNPRGVPWYYGIGNSTTGQVTFTLRTDITVTNELGSYFEVLSNLNNQLGPYYRYESGSSMAAAGVSGTLALMQEYFEQRLSQTNSPALMKALLINGARSIGNLYDLQVTSPINYQGWGMPNLTNTLPVSLGSAGAGKSMHYFDQSPTEALASGQSRTRAVQLNAAARSQPMRITLVWTDPPGNPVASVKLVNNLDLVVTNFDNGDVFFGNDLVTGNDFNLPWSTNVPPNLDVVNNVESVMLSPQLGTNYSITVIGRRINVNAVSAQTNDVVQDYALVISSGNGEVSDGITLTGPPTVAMSKPEVFVITNGFNGSPEDVGGILLNQRAGAHSPLLGLNGVMLSNTVATMGDMTGVIRLGVTNQWHFYAITNSAAFTNAAFLTFLPPNLAVPRMGVFADNLEDATRTDADLDLYVSREPALTNLDAGAIARAEKSVGVGGTETIVYSNAVPGMYYIGVKSEDMESAEYGFLGVFSLLPFAQEDEMGNLLLRGFPSYAAIPDGSPQKPGGAYVFAVAPRSIPVRRAIVTNNISHQLMGDLLGTLSHGKSLAVLNNHSPHTAVTNQTYIYDDSGEGDVPGARRTDGPGSLTDFGGQEGVGQWMLTQVDNKMDHVGTNNWLRIFLERQQDLANGITATILPGKCRTDFVEVPLEGTNLTVTISVVTGTGPIALQVCPVDNPEGQCYTTLITNAGVKVIIDLTTDPPLNAGTYSIQLCNLGLGPITVNIKAVVQVDLTGLEPLRFRPGNGMPIRDDAVTYSSIFITNNQKIAAVDVGLRVNHPRVSDVAFTLISPSGTRVLLSENRGGTNTSGMGLDTVFTNVAQLDSKGGAEAQTNVIDTGQTSGTIQIDYNFWDIPDFMRVYYGNALIFDSGMVSNRGTWNIDYGPGTATDVTLIMNEGNNPDTNTAWLYTVTSTRAQYIYLTFTDNTNYTSTPIKFASPPFTNFNYIGTNVELAEKIFYYPEEPLNKLLGERALGEWKLEMWDNRVGATNPPPRLVSWELAFMYENTVPRPQPIYHDTPTTNTVGPGRLLYFSVDVPDWARFATNTLLFATSPVNLLFNQLQPPTGTNGPNDVTLLAGSLGGFATLSASGGTPVLRPGQRYYLAVQNTNTVSVTFGLQVDFDVTPLTNNVPLSSVLAAGTLPRYFSFDVSSNALVASFQLLNLSGDVNLVASKGIPFPNMSIYDYYSFNFDTNDEEIVVSTNSNPVPLSAGRWYLGVFNSDLTNVAYTILAKEITEYPTNIVITNIEFTATNLCLTWTSIPGNSYYVEGRKLLTDTNWFPVSPTIVATDYFTTYCIALPSPYTFFRVRAGTAPDVPPTGVSITSISYPPAGVLLEWSAPTNSQFQVHWTAEIEPTMWQPFGDVVTSTNGFFFYLDNGSKTGGLTGSRYYRLEQLP